MIMQSVSDSKKFLHQKEMTRMKKFISLIMMLCILVGLVPFATVSAEDTLTPDPTAYPSFATADWEALYAHAITGSNSTESWQKWMKDYTGINAEEGIRYFFLPASADDNYIEIYNGYGEGALIGETIIPSRTSAFIEYKEDTVIDVKIGENRSYKFKVFKSDAEASLYINDTTNSYEDYEGNTQNTDLWSFLIQNKENYC